MPNYLTLFVFLAIAWRLLTVAISIRNEIALRRDGAHEVGQTNSVALALVHVLFYLSAITEGAVLRVERTGFETAFGVGVYLFSACVLISVMRSLGPLWTIKIMIASGHRVVRTGLFSRYRHPNYFLNILPELAGFALALGATGTLLVGLPIYLIPLGIRIRQEEAAMAEFVPDYAA
ncbi:isoprenylcysteine carboxylmethyltransferase family protein [Rhizobium sp. RAF36]|uniref:isoprenylcysteine carboxylmethyltransferase family protein n=1 Tax=Rhizobium sp. RAF36 TaxID=3233055 RepID=UPI003F988399